MSKRFAALFMFTLLVLASLTAIAADSSSQTPGMAPMKPAAPPAPSTQAVQSTVPATKHVKMSRNMTLKGTIQSIDSEKHEMVIKDTNGMERTIWIDPAQIGGLKATDKVKITLKEGATNAASSVRVLKMQQMSTPSVPQKK